MVVNIRFINMEFVQLEEASLEINGDKLGLSCAKLS